MLDAYSTVKTLDGTEDRIPVAKLGSYKDPRYGAFSITRSDVQSWQTLLAGHFGGRVPVDYDHNTDKQGPTGSEAGAWITGLSIDETGQVWGDVDWTPDGRQAVKDKRYLFISPTFGPVKDEQDRTLGQGLMRAAFTNNPFLRSMPAISLDAAPPVYAERTGDANSAPSDSRPAMTLTPEVAKALGLAEDADDATVLAAVTALQAKPAAETKTLEAQATEAGKVLLDSAKVAELTLQAQAGADAAKALAERDFTDAIKLARSKGQIDTVAETETRLRSWYEKDAKTCLEHIAALPVIVNLAAAATTSREQAAGGSAAPDGVDAESYELDKRVQAHAAEKNLDYPTALDQVLALDASKEA